MKIQLWLATLSLLFVSLMQSCHKLSNELKPYSDDITYESTISSSGNVIALVTIEQKIVIGTDSLTLNIKNPNNQAIDSMELLVYFDGADNFDEALNYVTKISIPSLAPFADTTVIIYSHPELPFEESEIKIKLIQMNAIPSNVISGYYQFGQAAYYLTSDTVPSSYSGLKGYIESDGNAQFWMKKNGVYKKMVGQFNDTIMLSGTYNSSTTVTNLEIALDTLLSANQKFDITPSNVKFRVNLFDIPTADIEKRIEFILYK